MAALTLALTLCPASALAVEQDTGGSNQTPATIAYPAEVRESEENGVHRIEKVYILSVRDDPAAIPTADFEREGRSYTLLDVIKNDQTETDTKDHIEVITLATDTKDVAAIIQQLESTLEVTTEDGYTGTLTPDYPGITVEADGYPGRRPMAGGRGLLQRHRQLQRYGYGEICHRLHRHRGVQGRGVQDQRRHCDLHRNIRVSW